MPAPAADSAHSPEPDSADELRTLRHRIRDFDAVFERQHGRPPGNGDRQPIAREVLRYKQLRRGLQRAIAAHLTLRSRRARQHQRQRHVCRSWRQRSGAGGVLVTACALTAGLGHRNTRCGCRACRPRKGPHGRLVLAQPVFTAGGMTCLLKLLFTHRFYCSLFIFPFSVA